MSRFQNTGGRTFSNITTNPLDPANIGSGTDGDIATWNTTGSLPVLEDSGIYAGSGNGFTGTVVDFTPETPNQNNVGYNETENTFLVATGGADINNTLVVVNQSSTAKDIRIVNQSGGAGNIDLTCVGTPGNIGSVITSAKSLTVGGGKTGLTGAYSLVTLNSNTGSVGLAAQTGTSDGSVYVLPATVGDDGDVLAIDDVSGAPVITTQWIPASVPSVVLLSAQAAANTASIPFTNVGTYYTYRLVFQSVILANTTNNFGIQFSNDNGATYSTTDYYAALFQTDNNGNDGNYSNPGSSPIIEVAAYAVNDNPTNTINGEMTIYNINNSSVYPSISGFSNQLSLAVGPIIWFSTFGGICQTFTNANAFQMIAGELAGGNITSGTFKLYGLV